ncbi:MAG: hypothetical protein HYR60_33050 [Acidobacteria bacterium]|nr:hypothetical protein [Acidobacteriota bacterium]
MKEPQLRRYLLGQLSEQEMAGIEERYFREDAWFEALESAEDELIGGYLRRELSPEDRLAFEQSYLNSPERRRKVDLAAALMRQVSAAAGRAGSLLQLLAEFFRVQSLAVRMSYAAAALLVILALPAAWIRVSRLETEVARLRDQASTERAASQRGAEQLHRERGLRERLEEKLAELSTVSFVLLPGISRGSGADLAAPATAARLRLQLELEREIPGASYRAVIRNSAGQIVWSQDVAEFQTNASGRSPVVLIPSAALGPGEYRVSLLAGTAGNPAQEIAAYSFRLVRR